MDSYKKEFTHSFESREQKTQIGNQIQQHSYQQMIDKRNYVNGTSTSIEDFKVLNCLADIYGIFYIF